MVFICAASAAAFFVACSGPSQRAAALAEFFAAWPATAHWRVPVGSIHNLHPAAEVIRALSTYPEAGLSARLLAIQAMLFAAIVWALLYGTFREAIWARREGDVRRVGHGPRLAPVYPEALIVRVLRAVLLVVASVTAIAWFFVTRARFGVAELSSVWSAFLATLQVPELQRDVLRDFAVTLVAVSALFAVAHAVRLGVWFRRLIGGGRISLGGVQIPRDLETNHFLFGGSTGTGKTELALSMARTLSERGERAVFIDYGANFLTRVARTGDF